MANWEFFLSRSGKKNKKRILWKIVGATAIQFIFNGIVFLKAIKICLKMGLLMLKSPVFARFRFNKLGRFLNLKKKRSITSPLLIHQIEIISFNFTKHTIGYVPNPHSFIVSFVESSMEIPNIKKLFFEIVSVKI